MDYSEFFDKLGAEAKQYLVDSDDKEFKDAAYHYLIDEYTFRGYDSKTMEQLISFVEGITNQRDGDEESRETTKEIPNNSSPEIPDRGKHNYRITDDEIGMGGAKEKFRKNITAMSGFGKIRQDVNGFADFTTRNSTACIPVSLTEATSSSTV